MFSADSSLKGQVWKVNMEESDISQISKEKEMNENNPYLVMAANDSEHTVAASTDEKGCLLLWLLLDR